MNKPLSESLDTAADSMEALATDLQDAMTHAQAVESVVLQGIIRRAGKLRADLELFRHAVKAEGGAT